MEYRLLGRTGVAVSPLTLGAMMFGSIGNQDRDACIKIIRHALDAGINVIDTADSYSQGESEQIVGHALAETSRDDVIVATKVHGQMGTGRNSRGASRRWIIAECENSLRRLGMDYIDLYQMHRPDPSTDIDETLGALTDLVRSGKIRYFGCSNYTPSQIVEALWVSERRGRERLVSAQPPYSILARGVESEVLPVCEKYEMGVLTWSPLAGGWLSGKFGRDKANQAFGTRPAARFDLTLQENQRKLDIIDQLSDLASQSGLGLPALALGFVHSHPAVTSVIIGPRTLDQLLPLLAISEEPLNSDILDRIDEIVMPGETVNAADTGLIPPALLDKKLRRKK